MKTNAKQHHAERNAERKSKARKVRLGLMAIAIGVTGSAIANSSPAAVATVPASKDGRGQTQIGIASWYGGRFNGRKTASGERFDVNALTCAHRTLPLGSWLRVTNLSNLKSIFLRVNDRGPVPRSRILDLSRGAARVLGITGLGKVEIEPIQSGDTNMADDIPPAVLSEMARVPLPPVRILVWPETPLLVAAR